MRTFDFVQLCIDNNIDTSTMDHENWQGVEINRRIKNVGKSFYINLQRQQEITLLGTCCC